jgi:hypothetical protein
MAWTKFAETPIDYSAYSGTTQTEWKVELYLDGSPPALKTIQKHGKIKLVRGNASPKDKWTDLVASTYAEVSLIDEEGFVQDVVEANPDYKLMAKIYKNSDVHFKGFITSTRTKRKFKDELNVYSIKVYDGFNRLKDFSDFTELSTGRAAISTLFYEILGKLNLSMGVYIMMGAYPKTTATPIRPSTFVGFDVDEWLTLKKEDVNYYDLLMDILLANGMQIFSALESFTIRQIAFIEDANIYYHAISSAGSSLYGTVNPTVTRSMEHLGLDPLKYTINGIDEVTFDTPIDEDANTLLQQKTLSKLKWEYLSRKGIVKWDNGFFKKGLEGWTLDGTAEVKRNSIVVAPGSKIFQASGIIERQIQVEVTIAMTIIAWMDSLGDGYSDIPLYRIKTINSTTPSEVWWLTGYDGTLDYSDSEVTRTTNLFPEIPEYPNVFVKGVIPKYYKKTIVEKWKFPFTYFLQPGEYGTLVVELLGGSTLDHSKPMQVTAQHNYCVVKLLQEDEVLEDVFPKNLRFNCKINSPKNSLEIEIPFGDEDPYLPVALYNMNDSFAWIDGNTYQRKTQLWTPGDKPIRQLMAERIVEFDTGSIAAYDVIFNNLPASWTDFYNTVKANFDGNGETVFLPVYEERILESHTSRMILVEHKRKAPTKTTDFEYIFGDS